MRAGEETSRWRGEARGGSVWRGGKESGMLFSVRWGLIDLSPCVVTLFSWSLNHAGNATMINCLYKEVDPRGHFGTTVVFLYLHTSPTQCKYWILG